MLPQENSASPTLEEEQATELDRTQAEGQAGQQAEKPDRGQEGEQKGLDVKLGDWLRLYWLYAALLLSALVIVWFVLQRQAQRPGEEAQYQQWMTQTVDLGTEEVKLSIAFPKELRLESPAESRSISVWLWRATPTPGPSPTPTLTSTAILTGALSQTAVPTLTLSPTPT